MRLEAPSSPARDDAQLREAAGQLEAILLRQLLRSSGVYSGGDGPGASVREGLFVDALAEAVEKAGGMGLSDALARSLGATGSGPGKAPPSGHSAAPVRAPGPGPGPAPVAHTPAPPSLAVEALSEGAQPLAGHVSSGFGVRTDPFTHLPREHHGVDLGAPEGTPIRATRDGVVRSAGPRGGYGNAVEVDHGDGVTTLYAHASELLVSAGETVRAGQEIARVGSTGRSTGPHLHFEVRVGGRAVDPARVLKVYGARVEADLRSGP